MEASAEHWPPGLSPIALRRCPPALRDDARQAAWLAVAEGRKPDSAVRALVRHEQKHTALKVDFSLVAKTARRF